jgi:LCP family protein required for cell wall assembly
MDPAEPEDPGSLKNDGPGAPRGAEPGSVHGTGPGLIPAGAPAATSTKTQPGGKSPDGEYPHAKGPDSKGPDSKGPDSKGSDSNGPGGKDPHTKGPGGKKPGSRRRKILAWTAATLAVIVVIGVLGAYLVYRHLNGNLRQVDISGVLGSQPVDLHPQAQNILVLGSDTRHGQARRYGRSAVLNTDHSDTLIIVHIAANRRWANIMSIPRDSWVSIPACRMGNGQMSSPTTFKINEAFTLGTVDGNKTELGVACTVKTIEKDTGIRIDHFVVVNFAGFRDMVRAVGGVPECNTRPINDPKSGLHLTAGHHLLNGSQALGYVRARYTLGNGSDLERISRQQAFMSSLVDRVKSKLLNPVAVYRFVDAATKSITIDSGLGGIKGLYDLATSLKNLPPSQVTFFTLPTYPRSYVDPTDTANVMWTQPEDSKIFQAFRNDVPVSRGLLKRQPPPRIAPRKVTLDVLNGSGAGGLEYTVAAVLEQDGFKVKRTGNASSHNVTQTLIKYHAGQLPEARLLAAKVHGSALQEVPGTGKITLLLGSNYGSTAHTGPGTKPQPASSFAPRTASQNICT